MKLDRIKFAELISYLSRNAGGCLTLDEITTIDDMIDVDLANAPVALRDIQALMKEMAQGTSKIEAIKCYRNITGAPLKDSKDAVEKYWIDRRPDNEFE